MMRDGSVSSGLISGSLAWVCILLIAADNNDQ